MKTKLDKYLKPEYIERLKLSQNDISNIIFEKYVLRTLINKSTNIFLIITYNLK